MGARVRGNFDPAMEGLGELTLIDFAEEDDAGEFTGGYEIRMGH